MNAAVQDNWPMANQRYLTMALARLRATLERHAARAQGGTATGTYSHAVQPDLQEIAAAMPAPPALETLCATFGLSTFERDVLLLCAGVDLDATFAPLCAAAQGDLQRAYPTFSLALAALPEPDWGALTPAAPLRRWRLIEVGPGAALTTSPLRIDERILHYLAGVQHLEERLAGLVEPVTATNDLVPSHRALAERIATTWAQQEDTARLPVVQLCGGDLADPRRIAAAACSLLGLNLWALAVHALPLIPGDLDQLARLWVREAALSASALLLECDDLDSVDAAREHMVSWFSERISGPLLIASRQRRRLQQRLVVTLDIPRPSTDEQRTLWQVALGSAATHLNGQVDQLVAQFSLDATAIHAVCAEALQRLERQDGRGEMPGSGDATRQLPVVTLQHILWDASRTQARPRLDDLAQRLAPAATWDDLVLPEAQRAILHAIAVHVRHRVRVYESWGFAGKGARGLGISALFAGSSGTGKTMAAEVLANALRLDLYRIDLSQVVSKYIGETEKNLRRVFDAAEAGGAILLFDEADALFGKRSEVKDSHDRYANIEVSYLLQRMEAYRGLAILTTNLKNALDTAFLRRLRFVVQFPFPDAAQRAEIWRRIFPAATPTEGLDIAKLARLNVPGGNIRNIALHAAFLAADAGEPVRMAHLLQAAHGEYSKLEKPLTETESRGWV
jgi:ATPase family associated with various cellular activities (AAA)